MGLSLAKFHWASLSLVSLEKHYILFNLYHFLISCLPGCPAGRKFLRCSLPWAWPKVHHSYPGPWRTVDQKKSKEIKSKAPRLLAVLSRLLNGILEAKDSEIRWNLRHLETITVVLNGDISHWSFAVHSLPFASSTCHRKAARLHIMTHTHTQRLHVNPLVSACA